MRVTLVRLLFAIACGAAILVAGFSPAVASQGAGSGDAAFAQLAARAIADHLRRNPSLATDLGVHAYDGDLNDLSRSGIAAEVRSLAEFRSAASSFDPETLPVDRQLDREQLLHALDAGIITLDVLRPWATDPDSYSAAVTNAAYVIVKRAYAPAVDRLRALVAREEKMPGALLEARRNLQHPPRISTEIAIEQIDGNISFFRKDVPAAFAAVTDAGLRSAFTKSNTAVIAALADYKQYLQRELLPTSTGSFAIGADAYAKALAATEMIDVPLDRLLAMAEADRQKNEAAFLATARAIDPAKPPDAVLAAIQADHPPAADLLRVTQDTLDSLRAFIVARHIVTIPDSPPAHVTETPPFMRSTTSASMDTPGPFEKAPVEAFYNMTLPDPRWTPAEQADFMRQWYYAAIANVSVHEVYPGHYLQFLYAKQFPSDVRKVYGAASNAEGWAHYCEQMMLDEGFHDGDPKYRLAQLQDALLRDVRFIAGISLHTKGMSVGEATKLFETAGRQPHPVAVSEAKRGTSDPLYGYYTLGKLMILKLRADYERKQGSAYSLQAFHDAFVRIGPLPIPLVRRAMLGETGQLF